MIIWTSAFAGIHDVAHPPGPEDATRLRSALVRAGSADDRSEGPFAVAWTNAPGSPHSVQRSDEPVVVVSGSVYDHVAGAASPEDLLLSVHEEGSQAMLRDLRGDFAVTAYDRRTRRGILARDHLGGRGLYWHRSGGRLCFASEIAYLLAILPSRPDPDPAALAHWLSLSLPRERTLYRGVLRLDPASSLRFGDTSERPRRYWAPVYARPRSMNRAEIAGGLRDVLLTAVRRRCREGTSTAALLSGGLDSSSVAGLAARLPEPARLKRAYSATFPDHPSVDEASLIDDLCRALDLRSVRVAVRSGSITAGAIEYIQRWDVPPQSPNLFFWFPLLRRAAADGTSVLLDGEAGDELFGLSPYLIADRLRRGRIRSAAKLIGMMPGGRPHLPAATIRRFLFEFGVKGIAPPWLERAVRRHRGPSHYTPSWLRSDLADAYMEVDDSESWKRIDGPRWWSFLVATLTQGIAAELTFEHVRLRGAQCGIEMRHPLVDVDVVDRVLGFPPDLAYDRRFSRPVLREAMAGSIPDSIRLRPRKSTFDAIFHATLAGPDLPIARRLLDPRTARLGSYVDLGEVGRRLLTDVPAPDGRSLWGQWLWRLVTTECWLRAQDQAGFERMLADLPIAAAEVEILEG